MIDFSSSVSSIKEAFKKQQLIAFNGITAYNEVQLDSNGPNDTAGFQIFTPQFLVKQMVDSIGDSILDFSNTILEPTSGDGAFTTYILRKRLETIDDDAEIESLKALSTIYSIEMDKKLILKQRNNIFTVFANWVRERDLEVNPSFSDIVKCIISTNFIWAMFNSECPLDGFMVDVAFKMPEAERGNYKSLDFPVWKISKDRVTVNYEGVEYVE